MAKQQFKFEPGSYGGVDNYMPSIACLKGSMGTDWKYHFVLVNRDKNYQKEEQAVLQSTKDLDHAFKQRQIAGSDYAVAESLKSKGYIKVDNFNIVK